MHLREGVSNMHQAFDTVAGETPERSGAPVGASRFRLTMAALALIGPLACAHIDVPRGTVERADRLCRAHHPEAPPETSFSTDGCSAWPDGPWQACCIEHDVAYWCGGSAEERAAADRALQECVAERGFEGVGWLMWTGVRVGGHPLLPLSWRWGYGRRWPTLYAKPHAMKACEETSP